MTPGEQAAAVARIRWRVPITEYVGHPDGYMATCRTCDEHKLTSAWALPTQAAVNRWVNEHRRWHQDTPIPDVDGLW